MISTCSLFAGQMLKMDSNPIFSVGNSPTTCLEEAMTAFKKPTPEVRWMESPKSAEMQAAVIEEFMDKLKKEIP